MRLHDLPVLAFDRMGFGDPLLLLHGFGSTRQDFAAVVPRLAQDFEVLAVDLPGHGGSPMLSAVPTVKALADTVADDLDAHGLGRVHVLGNSLGGRIALELARRGRALSVVALAPSGLAYPPERALLGGLMGATRIAAAWTRPLMGVAATSTLGRVGLLSGLRARPWEASEAEALTMRGGFADASGFWSMLWTALLLDVPEGLADIDCPVVLAQGTADLVGAGQTPRYLPFIADAEFHLLPGAGHAAHGDAVDAVIRLVQHAAERALVAV